MSGLKIAELPLQAGWLGICPLPGRQGDYAGDLTRLIGWAPDMVLTLAGTEEMTRFAAAHLGRDLERARIGWRHMPITDYGLPDAAEEARWPALCEELLGWFGRGGRVVIHCKGGCGRSGMIALRLMIAAGEAPETALARLRAARPCAIETEPQMAWALGAA